MIVPVMSEWIAHTNDHVPAFGNVQVPSHPGPNPFANPGIGSAPAGVSVPPLAALVWTHVVGLGVVVKSRLWTVVPLGYANVTVAPAVMVRLLSRGVGFDVSCHQ